jgi:hypothetical protein
MIQNFFSFDNIENIGGCYELFNFIPASLIDVMPDYANGYYSSQPTFYGSSVWLNGKSLQNKLSFSDEQIITNNGKHYKIVVQGFIPKLTYQYLHLFHEMSQQKFILKITDGNGSVFIIGTKKEPLSFKFSRKTESTGAGLAGHSFEFFANSSLPAVLYVP